MTLNCSYRPQNPETHLHCLYYICNAVNTTQNYHKFIQTRIEPNDSDTKYESVYKISHLSNQSEPTDTLQLKKMYPFFKQFFPTTSGEVLASEYLVQSNQTAVESDGHNNHQPDYMQSLNFNKSNINFSKIQFFTMINYYSAFKIVVPTTSIGSFLEIFRKIFG